MTGLEEVSEAALSALLLRRVECCEALGVVFGAEASHCSDWLDSARYETVAEVLVFVFKVSRVIVCCRGISPARCCLDDLHKRNECCDACANGLSNGERATSIVKIYR